MKSTTILFLFLLPVGCSRLTEPVPLLTDYFPLSPGNQWSFVFSNSWSGSGYPSTHGTTRGTSDWQIISSDLSSDSTFYSCEETINAVTLTYSPTSPSAETTVVVNVKFHFTITETADRRISAHWDTTASDRSPNWYVIHVFQDTLVYRYGDPAILGNARTFGDVGAFGFPWLILSVGTGPTKFGFRLWAMSGSSNNEAELVSHAVH